MNDLKSLSEIFQKKLFRIPDYQRGYAWQTQQLQDFWEDLINLPTGKTHYTGLLSIKQLDNESIKNLPNEDKWLLDYNYKVYHIVDGQQRLTTSVILINELVNFVLANEINKNKQSSEILLGIDTIKTVQERYLKYPRPNDNLLCTYIFGYENDNPSAKYLKHKILGAPNSGELQDTYYTKNLINAKNFFHDEINTFYQKFGFEGINSLYNKLTEKLKFNIHEIDDDYDVFVAFETMNNRGKRLTNLELLKNRLIYLTTLYETTDLDSYGQIALREKINEAWKEIYHQLGRNQNQPLSDDEFLRAHWIMYFTYSRKKGDDYIKFLLRKFSHKSVFKQLSLPIEHFEIEEVSESFDDQDTIDDEDFSDDTDSIDAFLKPEAINEYVNSLNEMAKFWYYTYFPTECHDITDEEKLWLDRINRINISYFRPLIAVALKLHIEDKQTGLVDLLIAIERFIFINFRFAGYAASYKSSEYYRMTKTLYFGNSGFIIQDAVNDINEVTDTNISSAINEFIIRTKRRFATEEGFYSWSTLKYFLFEYEYSKAVELNRINEMKIDWKSFTAKQQKGFYSIEHILPQTSTKLYWRNQYRQFTSKEIKFLTGSLGNLLPLATSINSKLQNDAFSVKKEKAYSKGSYSELEIAEKENWTATDILNRGLTLLNFMEKRWNFNFLSNQQKQELLSIKFVNDERIIPEEIKEEIINENKFLADDTDNILEKRKKYWTFALPILREKLNGPYGNRNPSTNDTIDGSYGVAGIHLYSSIKSRSRKIVVGLWIDTGYSVTSKKVYDFIYKDKDSINEKFSNSLIWDRKDGKRSCSISMSLQDITFEDTSKWQEYVDFQVKYAELLSEVIFYPRENEIKSIIKS